MSEAEKADYRPKEIRLLRVSGELEIVWQDDSFSRLPFALLRSSCRCAACRSERIRNRSPCVDACNGAVVSSVRLVGSYAVQLVFDDGHERGIFPFAYLRGLTQAGFIGSSHA